MDKAILPWLPIELQVLIMAAIPVIELKGAILYGIHAGLPLGIAYGLGLLGSCIPVPFLLFFLQKVLLWMERFRWTQAIAQWIKKRSLRKSQKLKHLGMIGLLIFVAVPLPTTGVWTGSGIAVLLGLPRLPSMLIIFLGNAIAGLIILLMGQMIIL